jgi:hypothetical protein
VPGEPWGPDKREAIRELLRAARCALCRGHRNCEAARGRDTPARVPCHKQGGRLCRCRSVARCCSNSLVLSCERVHPGRPLLSWEQQTQPPTAAAATPPQVGVCVHAGLQDWGRRGKISGSAGGWCAKGANGLVCDDRDAAAPASNTSFAASRTLHVVSRELRTRCVPLVACRIQHLHVALGMILIVCLRGGDLGLWLLPVLCNMLGACGGAGRSGCREGFGTGWGSRNTLFSLVLFTVNLPRSSFSKHHMVWIFARNSTHDHVHTHSRQHMHTHTHAHTHTHTHTHTHKHMHVRTPANTCTNMHSHTHTHTHTHRCAQTFTHTHTHTPGGGRRRL